MASGKRETVGVLFFRAATLGSELALNIAVPLVGGVLLGAYLDRHWNTSPLFLLIFLFMGLSLGAVNFVRLLKKVAQWK